MLCGPPCKTGWVTEGMVRRAGKLLPAARRPHSNLPAMVMGLDCLLSSFPFWSSVTTRCPGLWGRLGGEQCCRVERADPQHGPQPSGLRAPQHKLQRGCWTFPAARVTWHQVTTICPSLLSNCYFLQFLSSPEQPPSFP